MKKSIIALVIIVFAIPALTNASEIGDGINAYREKNNLAAVIELPALCTVSDIRLKQIRTNFSHDGFYAITPLLRAYGEWYENLAVEGMKIKGSSGVLKAWINSKTHNDNLLSGMKFMCVKKAGKYWSLIGWNPKS